MQTYLSALYKGNIFHSRNEISKNKFKYPMFLFALDLDNLKELENLKFLKINSFGLFSFYDRDHLLFWKNEERDEKLEHGNSHISGRIKKYLKAKFPNLTPTRIVLVTNLRILGYVFNPVSFYYIYEQTENKEKLKLIIAEVNNTFGEQRIFLIENIGKPNQMKKMFYVSPFIPHNADFKFEFNEIGEDIFIRIDSNFNEKNLLKAIVTGKRLEISDLTLLKIFMQFPFYTLSIITRIHWQALKLYLKKVPYFGKKETDEQIVKFNNL